VLFSPVEKSLLAKVEPEIEALGFECIDLALSAEAGRRILRITLDSTAGVKLDECAAVSRALAPILDALEEVPENYYLEVSSPGVNRPLTKPEHFRRFRGERVKLRLVAKLDGGQTLSGVIGELQDGVLTVETTVGPKQVPLDQIARARLHCDLDALLKAANARSKPDAAESDVRRMKR
jgi:ribosome maturation factor RimP